MADSKTPETVQTLEEARSTDPKSSLSSQSSLSSNYKQLLCSNCKRQLHKSASESFYGDKESDIDTLDSSWTNSSDLNDTFCSSNGSGYMTASTSTLDESSEVSNDSSSYFCDRSASSTSCSETDDFSSESVRENFGGCNSTPKANFLIIKRCLFSPKEE